MNNNNPHRILLRYGGNVIFFIITQIQIAVKW